MMVHFLSRIALVSFVLALGAACGSSDEDGGGSGGGGAGDSGAGASGPRDDAEPAAMNGMTAAHNAVRASVDPSAANPIPPLTWSPEVAAVAQAYAETCRFEHNLDSGYGENMHANTGTDTPSDVVESWASEAANYDYDANACSGGKCGHYTQVVWAASLRLGCGMAECTENSPFGSGKPWQVWVCDYDPPGNFGDARPY
jgi:pathogenesis-related protein 1